MIISSVLITNVYPHANLSLEIVLVSIIRLYLLHASPVQLKLIGLPGRQKDHVIARIIIKRYQGNAKYAPIFVISAQQASRSVSNVLKMPNSLPLEVIVSAWQASTRMTLSAWSVALDALTVMCLLNAHHASIMMIPGLAQKITANARLASCKLEIQFALPVLLNAWPAQQAQLSVPHAIKKATSERKVPLVFVRMDFIWW